MNLWLCSAIFSISALLDAEIVKQQENKEKREAFSAIENSVTQNLNGVITRTQSFSSGMTNIFHSMADEIRNTWMKMWYETTIKKPLMGLLGNIFGGIFGGKKDPWTLSNGQKLDPTFGLGSGLLNSYTNALGPQFATGGTHKGGFAIVGEKGPELAYFTSSAHIYDAKTSQRMMVDDKVETHNIIVNVVNKTGTDMKATATSRIGDSRTTVIQIIAEGIQRNEGGLQDLIAAVGGKR